MNPLHEASVLIPKKVFEKQIQILKTKKEEEVPERGALVPRFVSPETTCVKKLDKNYVKKLQEKTLKKAKQLHIKQKKEKIPVIQSKESGAGENNHSKWIVLK